jgi:hypothetical protein
MIRLGAFHLVSRGGFLGRCAPRTRYDRQDVAHGRSCGLVVLAPEHLVFESGVETRIPPPDSSCPRLQDLSGARADIPTDWSLPQLVAFVVTLPLSITVALYNRPKWLVPPPLRSEKGVLAERRALRRG